jgi:hypothetical protein
LPKVYKIPKRESIALDLDLSRSPSSQADKNKETVSPIRPIFANRFSISSESTDSFRYINQQKSLPLNLESGPKEKDRGRERDSSNADSSSQRRNLSSSSYSSCSSNSSRSRDRRSRSPIQVPHYFNDLENEEQSSVPKPQKQYIEYEFYEFDDEKDDDLEKSPIVDNMSPADLKKLKTEVLLAFIRT